MIDVVLEALNETQDRISTQTAEKLEGVVKGDVVEDLKNEMEVLARRLTFSEGVIQENEKDKREIRENVDINRVRFNKIKNELDMQMPPPIEQLKLIMLIPIQAHVHNDF